MSPISWSLILFTSITLILILVAMIYFSKTPNSPFSQKDSKYIMTQKWEW
nr:ATP synthase F0 subunit 8 [Poecilasma litum]UWM12911.1 ATP synthase F0 subunit 8 [Poecilasma litum]